MANITILKEPVTVQPAYNDLIYVVSSINYAQDNFKYIADITISGETFRLKVFPNIDYNTGIFDFQRIVRNYITQDIDKDTYGFQENVNSQLEISVSFGEEYGLSSSGVTAYPNQVTSSSTHVWNGAVDFLPFANYDKDSYVMASGNTTNYLNSFPTSAIIRSNEYAWLYALNESSGTIYHAKVATYDSNNSLIQEVKILNDYQAITSTNSKAIRFSSGHGNLNLIPSSGITEGLSLGDSLTSYYKADNDATDSTGTNDATEVGVTYDTGVINQAFSFDGVNDYVKIGTSLFMYSTFTLSFWVKMQDTGLQIPFSNWDSVGNSKGFYVQFNAGQISFVISYDVEQFVFLNSVSSLSQDTWYHILITRQAGTGSSLYINGSLDNSNTNTNDPSYSTPFSRIGARGTGASTAEAYMTGLVDEVGIWNRVLSSDEIASVYNSGSGNAYPFTIKILDDSVKSYSITFEKYDGTAVSPTQWFLVDSTCTENTIYRLHWLNELGAFDSFSFIRASKNRVDITRNEYKKNIGTASASGYGYTTKDRSRTSYNTKVDEVITIQSDWVSEATNNMLEELLTSPDVYLDDAVYGLVPINIINSSFDLKKEQTDRLWNVTIDFRYSFDKYRQTR